MPPSWAPPYINIMPGESCEGGLPFCHFSFYILLKWRAGQNNRLYSGKSCRLDKKFHFCEASVIHEFLNQFNFSIDVIPTSSFPLHGSTPEGLQCEYNIVMIMLVRKRGHVAGCMAAAGGCWWLLGRESCSWLWRWRTLLSAQTPHIPFCPVQTRPDICCFM